MRERASRDFRELLVADVALLRGVVEARDVAAALQRYWDDRDTPGTSIAGELIRIARLEPHALDVVLAEVDDLIALAGGDSRLAFTQRGGLDRSIHAALCETNTPLSRVLAAAGDGRLVPLRSLPEDRYGDFEVVGAGGMGIVYLAIDKELSRKVAFKIVRPDAGSGATADSPTTPVHAARPARDTPASRAFQELEARFLHEARVTGGLEHPGIVPVYEVGQTPGEVPYYTMRFVRGQRTMADALDEVRGGPVEDRLSLLEPFLKLCDTVAYAHSRGVIHRDLKPHNVALGEFGEVVLLDWGLAKLDDREDATASTWLGRVRELRESADLHTAAAALGTPGYMSPEAVLGHVDQVNALSDVYSLGALLYEILTGELPCALGTYAEYLDCIRSEDPKRARDVVADVPESLSELAARCLARDPAHRPDGVAALARALRSWQASSRASREIDRHLANAQAALDAARQSFTQVPSGTALLANLDSATAPLRRVLEMRSEEERATRMLSACDALRAQALEAEARAARRAVLKRGAVAALLLVAVLTPVFLYLESRRRLAEELQTETAAQALVSASGAASEDPVPSLLLAREAVRRRTHPVTVSRLHAALLDARLRTRLRGHAAQVLRVAFSPDGRTLASASADDTVILWTADGWKERARLPHEADVTGLHWSKDGGRLLTAGHDGIARLWGADGTALGRYEGSPGWVREARLAADGELVLTVCPDVPDESARLFAVEGPQVAVLGGHAGGATHGLFAPDGRRLVTVDHAGILRLWNRGGELLGTLTGHEGLVNSLSFSLDGRLALTASADGTARIWDLEGGEHVVLREAPGERWNAWEGRLSAARFLPDGRGVVTGNFAGHIVLWSLRGERLRELSDRAWGPGAAVSALRVSPDGVLCAWARADGSLHLARTRGVGSRRLGTLSGPAFDLAFSPDGRFLATDARDGVPRVFTTEDEEVETHRGDPSGVRCLVLDPSSELYAVGRANGRVELWTVAGRLVAARQGHEGEVNAVAWSPGGDRWATSSGDGTVREWSRAGAPLHLHLRHSQPMAGIGYSGDGAWLGAASFDGFLFLWGPEEVHVKTKAHEGVVHCLDFAPDGRGVLTGGDDGAARLWDLDGDVRTEIRVGNAAVTVARHAPDGRLLLIGSHDGGLRLYRPDGSLAATPPAHDALVTDARFSPDGSRFLTTSWDKTGHLYDLGGTLLASLFGHEYWVMGGTFSADGRTIATAGWDGTARLWDLDGRCTGVLRGHDGNPWAVAFAGSRLLTGADDGSVKVWFHRSEDLLRLATERAGRDFSEEERARYRLILSR